MTASARRTPIPFGDYVLLDRINIGGMAEVWRGKTSGHGGIERLVAIKRMLPGLSEDDVFRQMIEDEANFVVVSERRPLVVVEISPLEPKAPPEPHSDRIKIVNPLFKLDALLVSFMHFDLGFFDQEALRVECAQNPFEAQVLPMSPE